MSCLINTITMHLLVNSFKMSPFYLFTKSIATKMYICWLYTNYQNSSEYVCLFVFQLVLPLLRVFLFPIPGLCIWGKLLFKNIFICNIQSVNRQRLAARLRSQKLDTMSSAMGWPIQIVWRTYPINTLPANPCKVTRRLPWHALPVSPAHSTCPASI